eukprot:94981-Chlamydomonas_euryale.AAC.2
MHAIYALHACRPCMPSMHDIHACRTCMSSMYAPLACRPCLPCMHAVLECRPCMHMGMSCSDSCVHTLDRGRTERRLGAWAAAPTAQPPAPSLPNSRPVCERKCEQTKRTR